MSTWNDRKKIVMYRGTSGKGVPRPFKVLEERETVMLLESIRGSKEAAAPHNPYRRCFWAPVDLVETVKGLAGICERCYRYCNPLNRTHVKCASTFRSGKTPAYYLRGWTVWRG